MRLGKKVFTIRHLFHPIPFRHQNRCRDHDAAKPEIPAGHHVRGDNLDFGKPWMTNGDGYLFGKIGNDTVYSGLRLLSGNNPSHNMLDGVGTKVNVSRGSRRFPIRLNTEYPSGTRSGPTRIRADTQRVESQWMFSKTKETRFSAVIRPNVRRETRRAISSIDSPL